jgi:hypothetical protein
MLIRAKRSANTAPDAGVTSANDLLAFFSGIPTATTAGLSAGG